MDQDRPAVINRTNTLLYSLMSSAKQRIRQLSKTRQTLLMKRENSRDDKLPPLGIPDKARTNIYLTPNTLTH